MAGVPVYIPSRIPCNDGDSRGAINDRLGDSF